MCRAADKPVPAHSVMKDLFDSINVKHTGFIELAEWNKCFGNLAVGQGKGSMKANPLSAWENSVEYNKIGEVIARNRKSLVAKFKDACKNKSADGKPLCTIKEAAKILDDMLFIEFGNPDKQKFNSAVPPEAALLTDKTKWPGFSVQKTRAVIKVGQVPDPQLKLPQPLYDCGKFLDAFKKRYKPGV